MVTLFPRRCLLAGALISTASIPLQAAVQCPPADYATRCQSYRMLKDAWTEWHSAFDGHTMAILANLYGLVFRLEGQAIEGFNNTYNSRQQYWITSGQLFPDCYEPPCPDPILTNAQAQAFRSCFDRIPTVTNQLLGDTIPSYNYLRGYLSRPNRTERAKKYCAPQQRPIWWNRQNYDFALGCQRDLVGAVDNEYAIIAQTKQLRDSFGASCNEPAFGGLAQYQRDNLAKVLEFLGDSACAKNPQSCAIPISASDQVEIDQKLLAFKELSACQGIRDTVGDTNFTSSRFGVYARVSGTNAASLGAIESYESAMERLADMRAQRPRAEATANYLDAFRFLVEASMQGNIISKYLNDRVRQYNCP